MNKVELQQGAALAGSVEKLLGEVGGRVGVMCVCARVGGGG